MIVALAAVGAAAVVQYRQAVRHTQEGVLKTDLFRLRDAIHQYHVDKGRYPASLDALVTGGYLRQVPEDPITRSSSTWQTVAAADPAEPSRSAGVYDVKSGARGTAIDGTRYADW